MAINLENLSLWFLQSLSPEPEPRRRAESALSNAADLPGYALLVLQLVSAPGVDDQIRHAAAVNFKNHIRSRWSPSADDQPSVPDAEKEQVKAVIVQFMLNSPPRIQSQISEALAIISGHDFPKAWPNLLPELVSNLQKATDYSTINGLLGSVNSIFKKFRFAYNVNETRLDLKYCLDLFAAPLLEVFLKTVSVISAALAARASPDDFRKMLESQRLCCRIFFSLNSIELPEFFEDHMKDWMTQFKVYLTTAYPSEVESDGTADNLRAAVCENLQLYMEKNEEEFKDYMGDFASAVWTLLMSPSTSKTRDHLTVTGIKFLTTISTSVHHALFGTPDVLQQICQSIVFPNIHLRDEDEELFEMDHIEYIRRDIEGSDIDTRRRIACELLKGIAVHYREQVMRIVSSQVQKMLEDFSVNPERNWKEKDCAIYLVISLATKKPGGNIEAAYLIDVDGFFKAAVVPELQTQEVNKSPMLKAAALKFFTAFRSQIPKQIAIQLLPFVIGFLVSESNVVHSYAANCIEKLLLVKDGGLPRYTSADINPFFQNMMTNLFQALQLPESQENPYVMKCIMRVLGFADVGSEVATACIAHLSAVLRGVCQNPRDPVFNHYLFEAIAALIGRSCEKHPSLIQAVEANLFPVLENILANDISEFWPYAFQIFAQLVAINKPPLSQSYMAIFTLLLGPDTWKRRGNVPALAKLLQAYLKKLPTEASIQARLGDVLGIFRMLVSSSSTEDLGFYILNTVLENLGSDVISSQIQAIWNHLFTRLQTHKTVKFVKSLLIAMSLVLVKHGPALLIDSINSLQNNLFMAILETFWIPNLKFITGFVELKLTSVASTRLICESPALLDDARAQLWVKMLDSIITLIARPEEERAEEDVDVPDIGQANSYSTSFVRLHNAGRKEEDPLKEIKDPKEFVVSSIARLSTVAPGKYPVIIQSHLDPSNMEVLRELCRVYNCAIV